jgi:hypothetical protein
MPQTRVSVVRSNRALSVTSPSAPTVSCSVPASLPSCGNTPDRFCPSAAFI